MSAMASNATTPPFELSTFAKILHWYDDVLHVPLVTFICVAGLLSHLLIILVLTRKKVFSPTNMLMISLSTCQLILLVGFLFFTYLNLFSEKQCNAQFWSYGWVFTLLFTTNFNVAIHACEVFHVVTLSIVRYICIVVGQKTRKSWFTVYRATISIILIYALVPLICIPVYLASTIRTQQAGHARRWCWRELEKDLELYNTTVYKIDFRYPRDSPFYKMNFWFYGIACKLLPCLFVTVMSVLLAAKLRVLDKRAKLLRRTGKMKYNRTSYLILVVMALFVVVELPQSVLNIIAPQMDKDFKILYSQASSLLEMLTVMYSSINFIIFCLMSGPFRETFLSLVQRAIRDIKGVPHPVRRGSSTKTRRRSSYISNSHGPDRSYILALPDNSHEIDGHPDEGSFVNSKITLAGVEVTDNSKLRPPNNSLKISSKMESSV